MSKKQLLETMRDFKFPKNYNRKNVLNKDQNSYEGFVLGLINNRGSMISQGYPAQDLSQLTKKAKYKPIYILAKKVMREKNPNFKFTSIQFNKNHKSARHKDDKNATDSYIIGLGDYTGGKLRVWSENEKTYVDYNIKNRWLRFNGAKHFHQTLPFVGERFTLVYYNI